eukprot:4145474-Pyramimonas_sp.AAC.1
MKHGNGPTFGGHLAVHHLSTWVDHAVAKTALKMGIQNAALMLDILVMSVGLACARCLCHLLCCTRPATAWCSFGDRMVDPCTQVADRGMASESRTIIYIIQTRKNSPSYSMVLLGPKSA